MYIQGEFRRGLKPLPVWNTIQRVQYLLEIDNRALAGLMRLNEAEFTRLKRAKGEPPLESVFYLCENLNMNFASFMTGVFDAKAVVNYYSGDRRYLPEKYLECAQTKKRVILNMLKYIEEGFGVEKREFALRSLQIHEAALENAEETVSLRLSVDLINWMHCYLRSRETLLDLGQEMLFTSLNRSLIDSLQKNQNVKELFEMVFDEFLEKNLEKNFKWSIYKMDSEKLIVRGRPTQEISHLERKYIISPTGMTVRLGILSSFPTVLGLKTPHGLISKPLEDENDYCELRLDLRPLSSSFS